MPWSFQEDIRLGKKLAAGGFGTVFRGDLLDIYPETELPVVVKKVLLVVTNLERITASSEHLNLLCQPSRHGVHALQARCGAADILSRIQSAVLDNQRTRYRPRSLACRRCG